MRYGLAYVTKRPHCIKQIVKMWRSRARNVDDLHWCIGADAGDKEVENVAAELMLPCAHGGNNYVQAANAACAFLSQHHDIDYLIVVSDDFIPPHSWDVALDSIIAENKNTRSAVIHVHDGGEGRLCTLPVVGISRYREFGFMYYPHYKSMFCDTELTARAMLDGVLVDGRHILFEHMHPVNKKRPTDTVDAEHASSDRHIHGYEIFARRLPLGFPSGNVAAPSVMANRYCATLQVTRDDICLLDVVGALFYDGVRNFHFNVPNHHWDGSPVSEDKQQVKDIAGRLVKMGAHFVRVSIDSLAPFFWPGISRGMLETNYRNFCHERTMQCGFPHQLIVDGDELFLPGAMASVDYSVRWHNPTTAALRGIPVVGIPAVAVEGATDRITCYIREDERWRDVRSPFNPTLDIGVFGVLHFSAVRRTREEIVEKMRKSGHYDDSEYHFEQWIKDVLPNLKPGMKNVHMYRDGSLWPETREFTAMELSAMPDSVKPLLWGAK